MKANQDTPPGNPPLIEGEMKARFISLLTEFADSIRMDCMSGPNSSDRTQNLQNDLLSLALGGAPAGGPVRLVVAIHSPGMAGSTPAVPVTSLENGFDWDAGRLIVRTEVPLTPLSPSQVDDITKSARLGQSWHAYQRQRSLTEEAAGLRARVLSMQQNYGEAFAIADQVMRSQLTSLSFVCSTRPQALVPPSDPSPEVKAAIDEAAEWLSNRGLMKEHITKDGRWFELVGEQS